jgi:hypothetical protein
MAPVALTRGMTMHTREFVEETIVQYPHLARLDQALCIFGECVRPPGNHAWSQRCSPPPPYPPIPLPSGLSPCRHVSPQPPVGCVRGCCPAPVGLRDLHGRGVPRHRRVRLLQAPWRGRHRVVRPGSSGERMGRGSDQHGSTSPVAPLPLRCSSESPCNRAARNLRLFKRVSVRVRSGVGGEQVQGAFLLQFESLVVNKTLVEVWLMQDGCKVREMMGWLDQTTHRFFWPFWIFVVTNTLARLGFIIAGTSPKAPEYFLAFPSYPSKPSIVHGCVKALREVGRLPMTCTDGLATPILAWTGCRLSS